MNGPTKDAGVERIARLEKLAAQVEARAAENRRWSNMHVEGGEPHPRFREDADAGETLAADLRSILAERQKLREALEAIVACDYGAYDMRVEIARAALAPSVASETSTDETRDRREVGR